ncbi:phage major capsid protein [Aerococcus sp. UMB8608]|nr:MULTISPECIES: phage major capsid protein [Aerococcus]MDK6679353.1 phage major capsid protein [Aerococcus sp. UMB8608]MDK6685805.1 phage major capsid protein [Aerococcus sp. UMB8623]
MNPIILANRIKLKRDALTPLSQELNDLLDKREQLLKAADEAESEKDLDDIQKTADDLKAEIEDKKEEKSKLEDEINNLEDQLKEINDKAPDTLKDGQKEGARAMTTPTKETREAINAYVHTQGETRDFTSVDGGALIPEELLSPKVVETEATDLSKYVNRVSVNSGGGKYPVIKHTDNKMTSVEELANNPKLANPTIQNVTYDVSTYRGYIPISQEVIDDANYDVTGLIANEINGQALNTKNHYIAEAMKAATKKAVKGPDGLKTLVNTGIKRIYDVKYYISASLYNALDLLKDKNGRYLLQDDITVESGKRLFGKEVIVLDDTLIGKKDGDKVGFVGDLNKAITLFDRKQASVKWVDHDIYGQLLAGYLRFDVKPTDTDAGVYVTYTDEAQA